MRTKPQQPPAEPESATAEVPAAPSEPQGILTALATWTPSASTALRSSTMGRSTRVMLAHVRDNLIEAVNTLRAVGVDAAHGGDADDIATATELITQLT